MHVSRSLQDWALSTLMHMQLGHQPPALPPVRAHTIRSLPDSAEYAEPIAFFLGQAPAWKLKKPGRHHLPGGTWVRAKLQAEACPNSNVVQGRPSSIRIGGTFPLLRKRRLLALRE